MENETFIDIKPLLDRIEPLIRTMQHAKMEVGLSPSNEHIVTAIKYQGINQMRQEFIQRLTSSIVKYVIEKSKYQSRKDELEADGFDESDAGAEIFQQATHYFRKSEIKGQFSELLLFNLLQYYFDAVPVVRKMKITTNPEMERNGADAIHLGKLSDNQYCVYLGEAKTYASGFTGAFTKAISSIIKAYNDHRQELHLHSYSDFLETPVRDLMKKYLSGAIDLPVKLVVIISYCTGETPQQDSKENYEQYYIGEVLKACKKITEDHYKDEEKNKIHPALLKEIHYILFPVNELEKLLADFQLKLGLK
ncbi:MAG: DUF1837 domain-containing protein [Bacteroidota bacterium]